jgi:polyribonucleotide nucleotidyltransferase
VVAGTSNAVLMVESEAKLLSEEVMLGAVVFGHQQMQSAIRVIAELAAEAAKPSWDWQPPARNEPLIAALNGEVGNKLEEAFQVRDKLQRRDAISAIKADVLAALKDQAEQHGWASGELAKEFAELEYHTMRDSVLKTKVRIDGRKLDDVRPITVRVGVLPRTHGSALFTRGETQALVIATLGTTRDAQPSRWVKPVASARRSVAKSATAVLPSAACRRSSRASKNSRMYCAWSPRSPSRTVLRRWHRSVVPRWP